MPDTSRSFKFAPAWSGSKVGLCRFRSQFEFEGKRLLIRHLLIAFFVVFVQPHVSGLADETPAFVRGINLNGPSLIIDGQTWEGKDAANFLCEDNAFENQKVALVPPTDPERAKMIRSSRWGGNRVELTDLEQGVYSLFLYVWEDNNAENFSITVNGRDMLANYNSGHMGHWERLGPWFTSPVDGKIVITSRGGAANFSGIELWRGRYDGLAEPIDDEQLAFFEKRIRPLLVDKCYECHSASSDSLSGDFLVDSRATLRQGGTSGPGVVPGDLEKSWLIRAVHYEDDLQMPPDEKLSDAEIADLEHWVKIGAPDPRDTATVHLGKQIDIAAAREFWSLRPIVEPAVPKVADESWPHGEIDRFILAELEQRGLRPAADASRRSLIRRATYDLTGLPPTPSEVADFLADDGPNPFARVVDRLLESPRYGERWGRHWFDVVRYADTAGDNSDYPVPEIYRYRDWVIDAFNRDLPYDEFVRDQLAGDLRGGETEEQRQQRLIATGYLANARRFGSRVDDYPWHLTIEDTLDNLGRAFLGVTISCARCHDHKFDPLTARDYYGLYGIFSSTRYPWPGIELDKKQRDFVPLVSAEALAELQPEIDARKKEAKRLDGVVKELKKKIAEADDAETKQALEKQLNDAEQAVKEHAALPPLFDKAYAVVEAEFKQDAALQIKGDPEKLGDIVRRHFPAVLGGQELPESCTESGRRELAEWIVSEDNPLPARVLANRLWHYHFGRGLVPTPNDFGRQGKPPTHPELLDYLAVQLRHGGWSLKAMHRQIMLSRAYQQSSMREPEAIAADPGNDWLAGFRRQRLDAESIRDTLLAVAGNIEFGPAGPHPFPPAASWGFTQHNPFKEVYETNRRSVYLMTQRIQRHPLLATFDGADPSTSTGARMSSTTPLQALFLLNDPLVHEQSQRIAERILQAAEDEHARVNFAYELLLTRSANSDELAAAEQFLADARRILGSAERRDKETERGAWQAYVRSLLRLNEFVYID
jgi:hypothetical protein